jgi:hypothetical protein
VRGLHPPVWIYLAYGGIRLRCDVLRQVRCTATMGDTSALDSCVLIMPLVSFMPVVFKVKSWIYLPPFSPILVFLAP